MPNFANDRSEEEMQTIALQALCSSNLQAGGAKKAAANITVEKYQSLDMVNVYGIKGKGVVFISKDDNIEPVLGISDEDFDVNNMPCGMKWWLNTANKSLERMKAKGITYRANPMAASGRPPISSRPAGIRGHPSTIFVLRLMVVPPLQVVLLQPWRRL